MSDPFQQIIDRALSRLSEIEVQIAPQLAEMREIRTTVNGVCKLAGRDPLFHDAEAIPAPRGGSASRATALDVRPDQFVGRPLATAVRIVLEKNRETSGKETAPMSGDDLHSVLVAGGFEFGPRDVENQKRGLQVSLAKNTVTFRRLPQGLWGLAEWYGRPPRIRLRGSDTNGTSATGAEETSAAVALAITDMRDKED